MAGTNVSLLNALYNTMENYRRQMEDWKQKSSDALALVKEYERQKKEHESKGTLQGQQDAENVSVLLEAAYGKNGEAATNVIKYTDLYNKAKTEWEIAKASLTPAEQAQLAAQQDAEIAQQNAAAKATADQSEIEKQKLFMQKNTQYIIIGVVVFVIAVAGFLIYKKFSK